jgi:hypothetical protein
VNLSRVENFFCVYLSEQSWVWWVLQLPADKGIGGREYMAGIRIVSSKPVPERMDVPLQSARTRCVHPERETASGQVQVFWDEVFIFEVKPGVS